MAKDIESFRHRIAILMLWILKKKNSSDHISVIALVNETARITIFDFMSLYDSFRFGSRRKSSRHYTATADTTLFRRLHQPVSSIGFRFANFISYRKLSFE